MHLLGFTPMGRLTVLQPCGNNIPVELAGLFTEDLG